MAGVSGPVQGSAGGGYSEYLIVVHYDADIRALGYNVS